MKVREHIGEVKNKVEPVLFTSLPHQVGRSQREAQVKTINHLINLRVPTLIKH